MFVRILKIQMLTMSKNNILPIHIKKKKLASNKVTKFENKQAITKAWKWKCSLFTHVGLFVTPWTVACQAPLCIQARTLECVSHSRLQGIFLTQGSNADLLHCRQIFYHLSHQGSPKTWMAILISNSRPEALERKKRMEWLKALWQRMQDA